MEMQFYGANCVKLTIKKATLVIDDTLATLGAKSVTRDDEIVLFTDSNLDIPPPHSGLNMPGEYEVADISIYGIAAQRHIDEPGTKQGVMYKIVTDDITVAVLGNVNPDLSNDQLEALGMIDILIVPVGGHGYTVDPIGALQLIKKIEPKVVIPTHYADSALNFPMPQHSLEAALKEMAMVATRHETRLKVKPGDLPDQTQLWVIEKQ